MFNILHPRPFLVKLTEILQSRKQHQELGKQPERIQPLQLISTDTWDISDSLNDYGSITNLLEGSITIVEDLCNKTEAKTREHLQNIVNDFGQHNKTMNPLLQEVIPKWGKDLSSFKIDTKVTLCFVSNLSLKPFINILIRLNL